MDIETQSYEALSELLTRAHVVCGGIIVVGCSTSEVCGGDIGKNSSPEAAEYILNGLLRAASESGVNLAMQCCEHLNRAIVAESSAVDFLLKAGLVTRVNAIPQPKAGGSLASAYYKRCSSPILLAEISADAGIDIGGTLIGMHLKKVAVPVKLSHSHIGSAHVTAARVRIPFVGGSRAVYDETLM